MSVEKIGNVMDVINANTKMEATVRKQPDPQTENMQSDVVSIGQSEESDNVGKIHWPPFFPIGDAQCIFKVEK